MRNRRHVRWPLPHRVHSHGRVMWHPWVSHHQRPAVHGAGPHGGAEQAAPSAPAQQPAPQRLPRGGPEGHQRLGLAAGREQRRQQADGLAGRPVGAARQPAALRRLVGGGGGHGPDGVPRRQLHEGGRLGQREGQRLRGGRGRRRRGVAA